MDVVVVEDAEHDAAAFIVKLRVPMFQKRMRVSEEIRLEFIAKGAYIRTTSWRPVSLRDGYRCQRAAHDTSFP